MLKREKSQGCCTVHQHSWSSWSLVQSNDLLGTNCCMNTIIDFYLIWITGILSSLHVNWDRLHSVQLKVKKNNQKPTHSQIQALTLAYTEPSQPRQIPPWRRGYWQEWRERPGTAFPPTPPCSPVSAEREEDKHRDMSTFTANKPEITFFMNTQWKGSKGNYFQQHGCIMNCSKCHSVSANTHTHREERETEEINACMFSSHDQSDLKINNYLYNRETIKMVKLSNYS